MSEQFLLPCSCGQTTLVAARQAGETIGCVCGRSLEVPTIRGLRALERVGEDETLPPLWTLRQGIWFLGIVFTLASLAFTGYVYWNMPRLDPTAVRAGFDQLSPGDTLQMWRMLRPELRDEPTPIVRAFHYAIANTWQWIYVGLVCALIGVGIFIGGFFVPTPRGSSQQRAPDRA